MKHLGVALSLVVLSLLVACGAAETPQTSDDVFVEMYKPNAKVVEASALTLQGLQTAEADPDTKVIHEHTFSNGEVYTYVTIDGLVVELDLILGAVEELEEAFEAYEAYLNGDTEAADVGDLETQATFLSPRCTFRLIFCFASEGNKWERGIVYYHPISSTFNSRQRRLIGEAMEHIEDHTRLRFEERNRGDRIVFNKPSDSSDCSSRFGRVGGAQNINLGSNCFSGGDKDYGTIVHEIGHAIGMIHEQQRIDRDSYVTINTSNLTSYGRSQINTIFRDLAYRPAYDYYSIMHYRPNLSSKFVKDTSQPAFTCKRIGSSCLGVGQRDGLSWKDIQSINQYY